VSTISEGKSQPATPVLEYPLDYVFKVMGYSAEDFPEHARTLVVRVVGDAPAPTVTVRSSAQGKYQSVSVSVRLVSEEQRRGVYQVLHDDERVVYYL
jgi:putative lipoic acid-binding regulatory protein